MKFGKLPDISQVDFTLPPDDPRTLETLRRCKGDPDTFQCYIGSSRWGEKDLVGSIYPPGTPVKDYLHYYSRQFASVEMNTTHYRIPTPQMVQQWRDKTLPSFRFCPKLPQTISHSRDFGRSMRATELLLASLEAFGEQLGMPFMQLPPDFMPGSGRVLFEYLDAWPQDMPLAVEFRHPGWFSQEKIRNRAFDLLQEKGISTVITDTAGRRDVIHQRLTTPKVLIRFVGNSLHPTDYRRLDDWVMRLQSWRQAGLQEVYFFVHQPEEHLCVDLAIYLVERINAVCQLNIKPPRKLPMGEQQELF